MSPSSSPAMLLIHLFAACTFSVRNVSPARDNSIEAFKTFINARREGSPRSQGRGQRTSWKGRAPQSQVEMSLLQRPEIESVAAHRPFRFGWAPCLMATGQLRRTASIVCLCISLIIALDRAGQKRRIDCQCRRVFVIIAAASDSVVDFNRLVWCCSWIACVLPLL